MTAKNPNAISWDDYFMGIAMLSAKRSKDPSTQVGACIIDKEKRIIGIGYNGFPKGCSDDEFPWASEGPGLEKKDRFVVHAEKNAILNLNTRTQECHKLYCTLFPCSSCTQLITQVGIEEVIYFSEGKRFKEEDALASRKIMDAAKIKYHQFSGKLKKLDLIY